MDQYNTIDRRISGESPAGGEFRRLLLVQREVSRDAGPRVPLRDADQSSLLSARDDQQRRRGLLQRRNADDHRSTRQRLT